MIGHRGFYHEGWSASTIRKLETPFSEEKWELHHLDDDPTEINDVSGEFPEKVKELEEKWEQAAWNNQVFPLDEGNNVKNILRPPWEQDLVQEMVLYPGTPTVERWKSQQLISFRNWEVEASFVFEEGDKGTLFAHGDQGGGYSLAIENGELLFSHNGYGEITEINCGGVPEGHCSALLKVSPPDFLYWNIEIYLNGTLVAGKENLLALLAMSPFQGIDIGIDRKSPVNWRIYETYGPFPFNGKIETVCYRPGDLTEFAGSKWIDVLRAAGTKYE
jgi:arylsulfatase